MGLWPAHDKTIGYNRSTEFRNFEPRLVRKLEVNPII